MIPLTGERARHWGRQKPPIITGTKEFTMHTPGPWYPSHDLTVSLLGGPGWSIGPVGRTVAACPEALDEGEDNARLLAAAPELLEALQELHALICGEFPGLLEGDYRDDMARAAIAKATGDAV